MYDRSFDRYLSYDATLLVTRPGTGTQDPVTGVYTPSSPTTVLECDCDVQQSRHRTRFDREGDAWRDADAEVWVSPRVVLYGVRSGDDVAITEGLSVRTGKVKDVNLFDCLLLVDWAQ